jgi:hypothetical protein
MKEKIPTDIERRIEMDFILGDKSRVISYWADKLKISARILYRYFERKVKSHYPQRVSTEDVTKVAALKFLTLDKKGDSLSTSDTVDELKRIGHLQDFDFSRGTLDRLMSKHRLNIPALTQPSPAIHLVSYFPNQVHEVDATVAPTYYLNSFGRVTWDPFAQARHRRPKSDFKLILYSGWDHFSGALYAKYFLALAENSVDLFSFLYEFWSQKKDNALPFYGFPNQYLYTDQGSIWKSKAIDSLMTRLQKIIGCKHQMHMPGEPRATGGAESSFRSLKRFEKKLRIRIRQGQKPNLEELNLWLYEFLVDFNNDPVHGRENQARSQRWLEFVESAQLKSPPPFIDFLKMAYNKGETRQITKFCEIPWHGKTYHLPGLEDKIGQEVLIWHGLKEDAIYVEDLEGIYGPFYPGRNEVPFGKYHAFPLTRYEKTKRQLKNLAGEILGNKEDFGFEDPTYVRQDNVQHKPPASQKIAVTGGVADAQFPAQQDFNPDEAMLYIAMNLGFYWQDLPIELKDFIANHLEETFLKSGSIPRSQLDSICAKLEPVLKEHGIL